MMQIGINDMLTLDVLLSFKSIESDAQTVKLNLEKLQLKSLQYIRSNHTI